MVYLNHCSIFIKQVYKSWLCKVTIYHWKAMKYQAQHFHLKQCGLKIKIKMHYTLQIMFHWCITQWGWWKDLKWMCNMQFVILKIVFFFTVIFLDLLKRQIRFSFAVVGFVSLIIITKYSYLSKSSWCQDANETITFAFQRRRPLTPTLLRQTTPSTFGTTVWKSGCQTLKLWI